MKTLDSYFDRSDAKREGAAPKPEAAPHGLAQEPAPLPPPTAEARAERAPPASGGLVIDAVELKGFMRYLDRQRVVFSDQFTVITGRTGAGKSSLLDAITFALYGKSTRTDLKKVKQEDICQPGGFVTVAFRLGEDRYTVTRGVPQQGGGAYITVDVNGTLLRGKLSELEAQVWEALGLDYPAFCNSTFIRQDEMRELGASTGAERLKIFQKLFRLDVFERAQKACKERLEGVRGELRELKGSLDQLEAALGRRGELEREAKEMAGQARTLEARLPAAEERAKELELRVQELVAAQLQARPVLEEMQAKKAELGDVDGKLARARDDLQRLERVKARLAELAREDSAAALGQQVEALRSREKLHGEKHRQLQEHIDGMALLGREHGEARLHVERRLAEQQRRLEGLSMGLTHEEAFGLLRREGVLEERIARIVLELQWLSGNAALVERLAREKGESGTELAEVRGRTAVINADCFVVTEIRRNMGQLSADIEREKEKYGGALSQAQARKTALERELADIGFDEKSRGELARLLKALEDASARDEIASGLRKDEARLAGSAAMVEEFEGRRAGLAAVVARLEKDASRLGAMSAGLREAQAAAESSRREYDALHGQVMLLQGQLKAKREELERLKDFEAKSDELRSSRAGLARREEVLSNLSERVFHAKGLALFALRQLLDPLSAETSQILAELTENRFSKLRLASYEEGGSFGILVQVEGVDGRFHDVAEFSGGERTQINAALRLAIASELARMPQAGRKWCRMRTLIIDEGDLGSLDSEVSRGLFVQKLFSLGGFFERVVLITHLGEVAELFGARLNVEMDALGRSRVEVVC